MAPILKLDPITGESLDRGKTPEQIAIEQAANEKFYAERKKRVKSSKKKKKVEEPIKEDLIVVVNPFAAQNTDPVVSELIEPFSKLLDDANKYLQTVSKSFKFIEKPKKQDNFHIILNRPKTSLKVTYNSDYTINEHIPEQIEYKPNYSTIPMDYNIFSINPKTKVKYNTNLVVDSIWFNAIDVREMVKHPKETKKVLLNLIQRMYHEMTITKFLKTGNKYIGTTVAAIRVVNFKDEFVELRLWSDITEALWVC